MFNVKKYVSDKITSLKEWLWNIAIGLDQLLLNTLLSPVYNLAITVECFIRKIDRKTVHRFGFPDETPSSVIGKNRDIISWCALLARLLDKIDKDHTLEAIEPDRGRRFRS